MKKLILCFDCGDTLVDEGTQVFAENEDVLSAEPIPGALEALRYFHEQGYRMALVADGRVASFQNILGKLGVWDLFEAHIISEAVGELKHTRSRVRARARPWGSRKRISRAW